MTEGNSMIPYKDALGIVTGSAFRTGTEVVQFRESLGRILAEDITSDMNMPPFNKASVDGYACRISDLQGELEVVEVIPAGKIPARMLGKSQCSKIMTGAPLPEGAECVIMVEETELLESGKIRFNGTFLKKNYAVTGEDIKTGDTVLKTGILIRPQDIAIMAAVGHTSVTVSQRPKVAIISSGSELVEPGEVPAPSQIRNSNAYQLAAQAERLGIRAEYYGIAHDDEDETFDIISRAIYENDIIIVTGGVSMGDFDFIPAVLEKAGVQIKFTRVAVQPGKPTTFGVHSHALVFGLPGNPVSSYVQFELMIRPLVFRMMGHDWRPVEFPATLKSGFRRKFADRMALVPVSVDTEGFAYPVEYHGSAHISSLHEASGLIMVDTGVTSVDKGTIVNVRQI